MRQVEGLVGMFIVSLVLLYFPGDSLRRDLILDDTISIYENIYESSFNKKVKSLNIKLKD